MLHEVNFSTVQINREIQGQKLKLALSKGSQSHSWLLKSYRECFVFSQLDVKRDTLI